MLKQTKTFTVGDRVAYSAAWLKSTGNTRGWLPQLRGTVRSVDSMSRAQLCVIEWTLNNRPYPIMSEYHDDGFGRVIAPNLTLISRIATDAALA